MRYNGTEYQEYIPNRHNWTTSILDIKLRDISEVICELNADIIGLEEIENKNALRLLQKSLKFYGCNYRYSAITHTKNSAIQVALLSKIEIENYRDIVVADSIRDILEVKFTIDKNPLYIFVNHWNSKKSPNSKRELSAKSLRDRLLKLPKYSEYIILGDFNSNFNRYRFFNLKRECNIKSDDFEHYNLWLELSIYQRWSYNFYGKKEPLDSIIIPYSLLNGKNIDYINNSFGVFKRKYLFHKRGYILRWQYKKGKHKGVGYSDHLAVYAKFSTKAYIKDNCNIRLGSIRELLEKDIELPIALKRVQVVSRFKNGVYIQSDETKIAIFGIDKRLVVKNYYDIIVYKRKFYDNSYEIVDFTIKKSYD